MPNNNNESYFPLTPLNNTLNSSVRYENIRAKVEQPEYLNVQSGFALRISYTVSGIAISTLLLRLLIILSAYMKQPPTICDEMTKIFFIAAGYIIIKRNKDDSSCLQESIPQFMINGSPEKEQPVVPEFTVSESGCNFVQK